MSTVTTQLVRKLPPQEAIRGEPTRTTRSMSATAFMTYLNQQNDVEQQDNIEAIRSFFEGFLAEFSLCYGHWKR